MNLGSVELAAAAFCEGAEGVSARARAFVSLDCFATARHGFASVLWMQAFDILVGHEAEDIVLTVAPDVGITL